MGIMDYNIPQRFYRDVATCGTYSHEIHRISLWNDWTKKQKEDALHSYEQVLQKMEEFCKLHEEHRAVFGSSSSIWMGFGSIDTYFKIDCSEHYWPKEMLTLVEKAIEEENKTFEAEVEECYSFMNDYH